MKKQHRSTPGRPRDTAKHAAILKAAQYLFIQHGYEGTSMDAIASTAGVSKLTIYNHFSDKENLFSATITCKCAEITPDFSRIPANEDLPDHLGELARYCYQLINTSDSIALHRLMISQSDRNPALASQLYRECMENSIRQLAERLGRLHEAGMLWIEDSLQAAGHFTSLICGNHTLQQLTGLRDTPDHPAIDRHIQSAVQVFIRAYAAESPEKHNATAP